MKYLYFCTLVILTTYFSGCSPDDPGKSAVNDDDVPVAELYFPVPGAEDWETVSPEELNWDDSAVAPLLAHLDERKTRAFIILKDGRIALEAYFGAFTKDSMWYWASAGKTLTSFTVGIAQEKQLLSIDENTSRYLGEGWTAAPAEKEALITIKHQLNMTTGLKETAFDCITPDCLEYLADAGSRWAYHNGPYTLLQQVISEAVNVPYTAFFNTHLRNRIGMDGFWHSTNGSNNVYFSTARSMARFGLLNLSKGIWDGDIILSDQDFIAEMTNTSQELNKSYGYLWWLNGKATYMAPGVQATYQGALIPPAPADTYCGLGKNDQKLYVVPSRGLVVVRMGEDTGDDLPGPSGFDHTLWVKINALTN